MFGNVDTPLDDVAVLGGESKLAEPFTADN